MEKYNESMYESLSKYVIERVKDILDEKGLKDWIKDNENGVRFSFDYQGSRESRRNGFKIDDAITEWAKENEVDMTEVNERTCENCRHMVCYMPDTTTYIIHKVLSQIVRMKYNEYIDNRPLETPNEIQEMAVCLRVSPMVLEGEQEDGTKVYRQCYDYGDHVNFPMVITEKDGVTKICPYPKNMEELGKIEG